MKQNYSIAILFSLILTCVACSRQQTVKEHAAASTEALQSDLPKVKEPHRYGGWYCPDNFGFVPVDIQKLNEVPAITDRLPTEQELRDNKSLIKVDTEKHPDARALEMDLPKVARIHSDRTGTDELIIVIQAIIVSDDTIVGYRFPNGGNGSAWMSDVTFLSEKDIDAFGSQPFFYSASVVNATKEDIWSAATQTTYFKELGDKFNKEGFFSTGWTTESKAHLNLDSDGESATGYIGTVFGNAYLHIDYIRDGFHYSEKMLMIENQEENATELFFASGPFPDDFDEQKAKWGQWFQDVKQNSETK